MAQALFYAMAVGYTLACFEIELLPRLLERRDARARRLLDNAWAQAHHD